MIERIIEWSAKNRWLVLGLTLAMLGWAIDSMRKTPLDAIPDLSDPQVIILTEWMGRSPDLVEDQITYPLVRTLQGTPGVATVRGYSMFGMSFIYAIFQDGTDIYWARSRVLEQLGQVQRLLPEGVAPQLGPDASGVGWIFQYVLEDSRGSMDLAELRALQDFTVRPALQAAPGVAEVASLGGFERQYQVVVDPHRLTANGVTLMDIRRAIEGANAEVGARVLEQAGREFILRGRGYARTLTDLEMSVLALRPGGVPILLKDVASIQFGSDIRRGAADWNGQGEAVGGIVVMRTGANALDVISGVKLAIASLSLPDGVKITATYDRSELIEGSIATLQKTLIEEGVIVAIICLFFLMHLRSALVAIIILPLSVLFSFIAMRYLGLTANIMSLGGIAIAIGELTDAAIVLTENAHCRLAAAPPEANREKIILSACKEVGRPVFFSLLLITVSFLPIFTLAGEAGRLFSPLAYTKTFAMFAAAVLSVTLAPPLMVWLLHGKFRREEENPVQRLLVRLYRPVVKTTLHWRKVILLASLLAVISTISILLRMGSEFLPPLDEGTLLVMPTTFPGISMEEAKRALRTQDRIIKGFPEVASVHGKTGRADTATDPAQLDMNEIVITLKPRSEWPSQPPEMRPRTQPELVAALTAALQMPGFQMSVAPPIRTRIDMLSTGVRTPVGIKVLGPDLAGIEKISIELEGLLRQVPGTRSVFAERQTGREYLDIIPDREAIARHGLAVRDVMDMVETAIGGMPISTIIDGRARYSVSMRYGADFRADAEALRALPVEVPAISNAYAREGDVGRGSSSPASQGGMATASDGMGMGNSSAMTGAGSAESTLPMNRASSSNSSPRYRPASRSIPLGELARVEVVTGPPMIKNENGVLVGYVFADIDSALQDLGSWVSAAKTLVAQQTSLPAGYSLAWTGQYEFMAEMEERMKLVLPLTLALIIALLFLALRSWPLTLLVLLTVPFAMAGSIWLLAALDYHLSTAVWVGIIAAGGVAAQTGIVAVVYLEQSYQKYLDAGEIRTAEDIDKAVIDGATLRLRPMIMTVATTALGLMPLLWGSGAGADLSARTAAPVIGGLWGCLFLTLLVLPAAYASWRRWGFSSAR